MAAEIIEKGSANLDIEIDQGATFEHLMTFTDENGSPVNVTSWTFSGSIKAREDDTTALASFTFASHSSTNKKFWRLTAAESEALKQYLDPPNGPAIRPTRLCYDVFADKGGGVVDKLFYGIAIVYPRVSD
jgi:hypothetical protein